MSLYNQSFVVQAPFTYNLTGVFTFIAVVALLLLLVVIWVVVRKGRKSGEYSPKEGEERELANHPSTSSVLPGSVNTLVHVCL